MEVKSCAEALQDWNEVHRNNLVSLIGKLGKLHDVIHAEEATPELNSLKIKLDEAENQLVDAFFTMDNSIRPSLDEEHFGPECEADAVNRYNAFVARLPTHDANYERVCELLARHLLT
jgi:hypothetical protein